MQRRITKEPPDVRRRTSAAGLAYTTNAQECISGQISDAVIAKDSSIRRVDRSFLIITSP